MITPWDEALVEKASSLWKSGWSAAAIRDELACGLTRSAILGKLGRLGLLGQREKRLPTVVIPKSMRRRTAPLKLPYVPPAHLYTPPKPKANDTGPKPREDLPEPASLNLALPDLETGQCKYPHGDGPFTFCGHAQFETSVYCEHHSRLAYQPASSTNARNRQAYRAAHMAGRAA